MWNLLTITGFRGLWANVSFSLQKRENFTALGIDADSCDDHFSWSFHDVCSRKQARIPVNSFFHVVRLSG